VPPAVAGRNAASLLKNTAADAVEASAIPKLKQRR
jgi:hypothetical protein